jgi:glutathione-independent formaldehyde dehydrogenase
VQVITEATDGAGVDCGIEAVGYQAHDAAGEEHPETVLDKLVEVVRATGRIGVVGVYNPQDREPPPREPSRAATGSTTGSCSTRPSAWVTASARSSATTTSSGT